jgi:hypothetical protein
VPETVTAVEKLAEHQCCPVRRNEWRRPVNDERSKRKEELLLRELGGDGSRVAFQTTRRSPGSDMKWPTEGPILQNRGIGVVRMRQRWQF